MACCASKPKKTRSRQATRDVVARRSVGDQEAPVSVVMLGEESCGKTSLVLRFTAQDFRLRNDVNMGAALTERTLILRGDGRGAAPRAVQLNIWDTPGSTKLHHLAPMYYKAAEVRPNHSPRLRASGPVSLPAPPAPTPPQGSHKWPTAALAHQVAIVVYDVTSKASFDIMRSWVDELKSLGPRDIRLLIAANKIDCDDRREVRLEEAQQVRAY